MSQKTGWSQKIINPVPCNDAHPLSDLQKQGVYQNGGVQQQTRLTAQSQNNVKQSQLDVQAENDMSQSRLGSKLAGSVLTLHMHAQVTHEDDAPLDFPSPLTLLDPRIPEPPLIH